MRKHIELTTVKISAFYLDPNPLYGHLQNSKNLKKSKTQKCVKKPFFIELVWDISTNARGLKFLQELEKPSNYNL